MISNYDWRKFYMKEIYIEIEGGVVQAVYAKEDMEVNIIDWDNAYSSEDEEENCNELMKEVRKKKLKAIF